MLYKKKILNNNDHFIFDSVMIYTPPITLISNIFLIRYLENNFINHQLSSNSFIELIKIIFSINKIRKRKKIIYMHTTVIENIMAIYNNYRFNNKIYLFNSIY